MKIIRNQAAAKNEHWVVTRSLKNNIIRGEKVSHDTTNTNLHIEPHNNDNWPPFYGDKSNGLHESPGHRFGEMRPAGWKEDSSTNEFKTHLFLSPFFKYISGLKVQFNIKSWSFHSDLCFEGN